MDILYVFNYRLMQKENQDSKIFFDSKKERLQLKLNELKLISKINVNELFSNTIPTYMEFESIILDVFSSTINPKYLLMSVQKEELCPSLCEHLLAQS